MPITPAATSAARPSHSAAPVNERVLGSVTRAWALIVDTTPGFRVHCTASPSIRWPLVEGDLAGEGDGELHVGVGIVDVRQVDAALQGSPDCPPGAARCRPGGLPVQVRQLRQLGEGEVENTASEPT